MASIISKKEMSEEDIKLNFITPSIIKKWLWLERQSHHGNQSRVY